MNINNLSDCFTLNNGVKIPCLGFGTWQIPNDKTCFDAVTHALKSGYRHIDTAAIYENEEQVGLAVKNSGIDRQEIFVTSKLWNSEQGYDSTLAAFDKTMDRLGLEYLDLYLIHWPLTKKFGKDYKQPNIQTWKAFEKLYKEKRIRAIGVSNFMPEHLENLLNNCDIVPAVDQIEFHPGMVRKEAVEFCHKHNILVEAWSPLCCGQIFDSEELNILSQKYGKTVAQICLRWIIQKGILPLPKSVNKDRIVSNSQLFDFCISDNDMDLIDKLENCGDMQLDPYTSMF